MSKKYALAAQKRDRAGKGVARALRRENLVPGVIYGDNKEPVMISMEAKPVAIEYLKGHMSTNLCELKVGNDTILTLARDIQLHPVTDRVEHVDFMRVTPKTKLHVKVPVHFINQETSPGLKAKGVLTITEHEIDLVCLANDIPEQIEVDLSTANIGTHIHINDIKLPKGAKPRSERNLAIASIIEPTVYIDPEPAAEGEAAEAKPAADGKKPEAKKPDAKK